MLPVRELKIFSRSRYPENGRSDRTPPGGGGVGRGGQGRVAAHLSVRSPHRSGRAQLRHPALRITASLRYSRSSVWLSVPVVDTALITG